MKRIFGVCLLLIFIASAYGQKAEATQETKEKTFKGDPIEFTCKHPITDDNIPLKVVLPTGWKLNPDFGTVVYQPANSDVS